MCARPRATDRVEPGDQCHQVHADRRAHRRDAEALRHTRGNRRRRQWRWHRPGCAASCLRALPPGRQLDHTRTRRARTRPGTRQDAGRAPWRARQSRECWQGKGGDLYGQASPGDPPRRARRCTGEVITMDCSRQGRPHICAGIDDPPEKERPLTGGPRGASITRPAWPTPRLSGLTVLVVDDDEGSRDYFAMALRIAGAVVATASTAVDALRLLQQHRPDVILSDIAMPGHDGYWLVREIRGLSNTALRSLPVVATTAYGRVHSRDVALAAGFVDHLP